MLGLATFVKNLGTSPISASLGWSVSLNMGHTALLGRLSRSVVVAVNKMGEQGEGDDCSVTIDMNGLQLAWTTCAPASARHSE